MLAIVTVVVSMITSSWYRPRIDRATRDAPVVEALNQAVAKNGRWGFWLCFDWLRAQGYRWNHKRVWASVLPASIDSAAAPEAPTFTHPVAAAHGPAQSQPGLGP